MNNEEWRATKKKESHDDSPSSSVWNVPASQRLFCLIWSWLKTIPSKINSTRSRLQSSATNQHTHDWHDICTRVEWNGMDPQPLILCYCSATRSAGRRAGGGLVELIRLFDHIKCNDRNANHKMKWMDRRGASRTARQAGRHTGNRGGGHPQ